MQYRREIDGLRAVAVIPVIFFHAGFTIFSGGYVGVDIFFVISGYLITNIIINELEQGTFSILRFYERRARRILPALFLVMLLCIPFAWMWMLPSQFKDFSVSLVAVAIFISNLLFLSETGYFAASAEEKPLLHTWSLAVEEQYYMLFPIFLILLWRFGRSPVFYIIVILSVLSLTLSEWGWRNKPEVNFYFTFSRFWELLAGSICAFLLYGKQYKSNNILSTFGLALIVFAIFFYDETTPFPSVYALAPVTGTALIIMYGTRETWVARLLSLKGFVGVGLISYSAYLWHQPLFAFARIRSITPPEQWLMLSLAIGSLVLAYFSWRYVEHPFRKRTLPALPTQRAVFGVASLVGAAFVAFGVYGYFEDGLPQRLTPSVAYYANFENDKNPNEQCILRPEGSMEIHPKPECSEFIQNGKIDVAFIGDSHSHAISYQAQKLLLEEDISSYAVAYWGCVGLSGFTRLDKPPTHQCSEYNEYMLDFVNNDKIPTIIITSRFTLYWDGGRFRNSENGIESGKPLYIDLVENRDEDLAYDDPVRRQRVLQAYVEKIKLLADKFNVILVYPIPEAGWNVPQTMAKLAKFSEDAAALNLSTSFDDYLNRNKVILDAFDAIKHPNLYRVKPHEVLCNTFEIGHCSNATNETVFYSDDDHLSNAGAKLLAPYILEQVKLIEGITTNNTSAVTPTSP
ncbi:MAG: acyltransferase [Rhodobacteraceae bacterium]|nr:MAG: acyltransferase [Paracoccaceae bacterium]